MYINNKKKNSKKVKRGMSKHSGVTRSKPKKDPKPILSSKIIYYEKQISDLSC